MAKSSIFDNRLGEPFGAGLFTGPESFAIVLAPTLLECKCRPEDYLTMFRPAVFSRIALLAGAAFAIPQLFACLAHPVKDVEYDKAAEDEKGIAININKDVDIVMVIDNSGSMAEEQATLSANFGAF
ncbi:MAG: hypothetical protein ACPG4T_17835, partial [Nannocystaceae bacterium]